MLITRESDYAIRIIRALKDAELLTIQEICDREQIPKQFAYKILKKLDNAELVEIRRGAAGGCRLNKKAGDITLFDIIQATDEDFLMGHCLKTGFECSYMEKKGRCQIHKELQRVQEILRAELERNSIEDLLK